MNYLDLLSFPTARSKSQYFYFNCLSVKIVGFNISCNLSLPFVSIVQQLLLVVKQLLVRLRAELKVRSLNNGINRAGLLTESTIDALGHVNIVSCCSSSSICSLLSLYRDCLCWADCLAQLTGDTTLLSRGIPPQCMFPSEPW